MIFEPADIPILVRDEAPEAANEWRRLSALEAYYRGDHRTPYQPQTATREFRELTYKSTTNLTRLIVHTVTQRLIVDGYRGSATDVENAAPWDWWQSNGLDSRQKSLYDEVAKHGYAGVMVLPGNNGTPVMRPVSPREWYLHFDSFSDDWPAWAMRKVNSTTWQVLDGQATYSVKFGEGGTPRLVGEPLIHSLGECPIVPFRHSFELTRRPTGEIEPIVPVQDRLNQTVFDLLVAQTYSAAPQKWIAGLSVPEDETGRPIVDLRAFAKSVWIDGNSDTKFGSLPEANLNNIVTAIEQTLRVYGLLSQTPPHYLLGDLVNLSAEALLAADTTLAKKVQDKQTLHGESWEQVFRAAAILAGDAGAATDFGAQVWWRDTEPRSIAQQVDALGKMAVMLDVPTQALWQEIPGITGGTLEYWRAEAARQVIRDRREAARAAVETPQPPSQPSSTPMGSAPPSAPSRGAA